MRLTLELLQQAPQSLNPAKHRQLLLRGYKRPRLENLGGTDDAYECLDLSDNDLIKLGNFPPLKRLRVLLLANNRISRIAPDCFDPLPQLVSLVLTGNKLEKLVDLEPITKLANLERLSLMDNPVTKASPGLDEWDEWGVGSGGWAGRSWDAMLDPGVGTPGLPQEL
ncbi:unnamed protein product [Effrenium voratum]|nr:unnamed protein product [Effrenium voratum]